MEHPERLGEVEVRFIQSYRASKDYICPSCDGTIPTGMGHYVVVPVEAPDLRRHWHRGCWQRRSRRQKSPPTRSAPTASRARHQKRSHP